MRRAVKTIAHTREWPVEDGIERTAVDVHKDGNKSIGAAVDAVEVDSQTQLVACLTCVEARTVNRSAAR